MNQCVELRGFEGKYLECYYVGSRVTCRPAPTDTDLDILVLVGKDTIGEFCNFAVDQMNCEASEDDYEWEGSDSDKRDMHFQSLRRGYVNIIVTESETFVHRFLVATQLTKRLNLMDKDDRIAVFRAVLYHETHEEELYGP